MANNVTGIQNIEPWIYKSGLNVNDTGYGLLQIPQFQGFNTTPAESTGINKDYYIQGEEIDETGVFQPGQNINVNTMGAGDDMYSYGESVETNPDYMSSLVSQSAYSDSIKDLYGEEEEKEIPKESPWKGALTGLGEGLMGLANQYFNQPDDYQYFGNNRNRY